MEVLVCVYQSVL